MIQEINFDVVEMDRKLVDNLLSLLGRSIHNPACGCKCGCMSCTDTRLMIGRVKKAAGYTGK